MDLFRFLSALRFRPARAARPRIRPARAARAGGMASIPSIWEFAPEDILIRKMEK